MSTLSRRALLRYIANVPLMAELTRLSRTAFAETIPENVNLTTPRGTRSAVIAIPATVPAPAVMLIHGSEGLTDQYKDWAVDFGTEGVVALAVDDIGGVDELRAWVEWLKDDPRTNGKVGVVGWSSGAQWALLVSMTTPVEATVVYVGLLDTAAERLAHLKGPVLAHLGDQDTLEAEAQRLQSKMREIGRSLTVYWYAAGHNFLWPGEPSYKADLAETAWVRTMNFLHTNLR